MNGDHPEDSLVIVHAFGAPEATAASMKTLDEFGGTWAYTLDGEEHELTVPWSAELSERPQIRREVVTVYNNACKALGVPPRVH